jgi:hypothetical protein
MFSIYSTLVFTAKFPLLRRYQNETQLFTKISSSSFLGGFHLDLRCTLPELSLNIFFKTPYSSH